VSPRHVPTCATMSQPHEPAINFAIVSQPNMPTCADVSPPHEPTISFATVNPPKAPTFAFATVIKRHVPKLSQWESTA